MSSSEMSKNICPDCRVQIVNRCPSPADCVFLRNKPTTHFHSALYHAIEITRGKIGHLDPGYFPRPKTEHRGEIAAWAILSLIQWADREHINLAHYLIQALKERGIR